MTERSAPTAKDRVTARTGAGTYTQNFDQNGPEPAITKKPLIYRHRKRGRRMTRRPTPPQQRKVVDWPINLELQEFRQSPKLACASPKQVLRPQLVAQAQGH